MCSDSSSSLYVTLPKAGLKRWGSRSFPEARINHSTRLYAWTVLRDVRSHYLCPEKLNWKMVSNLDVAEENIQPMLAPSSSILTQLCQNVHVLPRLFTGILRKRKENTSSVLDNGAIGTDTMPTKDKTASAVHIEDSPARARFSLSPELNEAYPEDEAIGDAWLVG